MTKQKQIIAVETVNKLCSKHGFHSNTDDECDNKSGPCSATASMEQTIGDEQKWANTCFQEMKEDGLEVKYLTTDGDTKAFQGAIDLYQASASTTRPEHQLDTRHLAENHRKQIKSNSNVLQMMPGTTATYRMYLRNRFAVDISKRCQAEFENVHTEERGNYSRFSAKIKKMHICSENVLQW